MASKENVDSIGKASLIEIFRKVIGIIFIEIFTRRVHTDL